eukprot:g1906.t1
MSSAPQQYFENNALYQAIKKHTPTRKDPSFYSWHERNPGTLYEIERRTFQVGSTPDTATKAAGFAEFCRCKYACKAATFTVQGCWLSDKVGENRVIRLILSEDLAEPVVKQYSRPEYYSLTIPDKQPNSLLDHTTVAEIIACIRYDSYKHCIVYNKKLSPEEEAAIAIQSRFRGHLARADPNTHKRNRQVKSSLNSMEKGRWKNVGIQGVKNQAATIQEKSSSVLQNWQYKSKGVTETSAEELNFLKKKRMANEARRRWKHSGILLASAKIDRYEKLYLVEKDEKTDNVFYNSKFDKIPHISTTRALPSTQKWKWKQQAQADDQNISYFHFSDYKEKNYIVDGINPVMPRRPTPAGKESFKIPTTYNVPRGQFGEVPRISPSKSRKLILYQRQNISVFKPV